MISQSQTCHGNSKLAPKNKRKKEKEDHQTKRHNTQKS